MAVRRLAIHVAQVGAWLVAAKDKCQHGEWLSWLVEYCPEITRRTATNYMKLYDKAITANGQLFSHLTPIQAYRELGIVKDPTDPEPVVTPPLPDGEYRCVIIDPPWPMQKINRDIIPYEEKLDYPVMTIDEIKELKPPFAEVGFVNRCLKWSRKVSTNVDNTARKLFVEWLMEETNESKNRQ